ncbi:interferon-stimulated gene 20 kDa protein-like [Stegostoma tigrinum]|uniref:interferon-stimulated gene 20 kDa protein-like n=1 Tax=Rhincodon typus TaxID=259920 RepID=UPI0009A27455|nr:interferon-stimulated gene 20 kDa protein-like [Rhincodon typus]XP_048418475.1 interferon-stimulated gene 20 kDa protein-like [Stegostoma tigrinum]
MIDPSKYVAIDCEMVGLGPNGFESGLARCSIVDYSGTVIYDKFIKPDGKITDFRTPVSGIRPLDMDTALPYPIAREEILKIIQGKIIVGHDPRSDFRVLKTDISDYAIRDTSSCKLLIMKARLKTDRRASLKSLCQNLLGKRIQDSYRGHSSVEDASAAMELFKLVDIVWELHLREGRRVEIVNRFENRNRYQ